jgi:hypothetical protein
MNKVTRVVKQSLKSLPLFYIIFSMVSVITFAQIIYPDQRKIKMLKKEGWNVSILSEGKQVKPLIPELLNLEIPFPQQVIENGILTSEQIKNFKENIVVPEKNIIIEIPVTYSDKHKIDVKVSVVRIYEGCGKIFCYKVEGSVRAYHGIKEDFIEEYKQIFLEFYDNDGDGLFEMCIGSKEYISVPNWILESCK